MKNLQLQVRWVKEHFYNSYRHVDEEKLRPVLVWINKSKWLNNRTFCFYCSTKYDSCNKRCCFLIDCAKNPAFRADTYVWLHKPIIVNNEDFIKNRWTEISQKDLKDQLKEKIFKIWSDFLNQK